MEPKPDISRMECNSKCVGVGMQLSRDAEFMDPDKSTPVMFDVNVRGRVSAEDMKVPHSELAMHVGAAGKPLIAWVMGQRSAHIIFEDKDGCCGVTSGLRSELLEQPLIKTMEDMFPHVTG